MLAAHPAVNERTRVCDDCAAPEVALPALAATSELLQRLAESEGSPNHHALFSRRALNKYRGFGKRCTDISTMLAAPPPEQRPVHTHTDLSLQLLSIP